MTLGFVIFLVVVGLGLVFDIAGYNRLVGLTKRSAEAWSDMDVQLKRRTDLVPNLVEPVKGYAAHERGPSETVVRTRGAAVAAPAAAARRRSRLPVALSAALLLAVVPARAQPRSFSIDRFAVTLAVSADGSLAAREAITFRFRGRHEGIYRTIPVRYPRGGFDWALRLEAIGVFDESFQPLRAEVSYHGASVRIKAWVPGAVDTTKTVTIAYRVRRGIFTVDDRSEERR